MTRPNRLFLYGPIAAFLLFLIGWYMLWQQGAKFMQGEIDGFAEAQTLNGLSVNYEAFSTRGFPFLLRGNVADVAIKGATFDFTTDDLFIDVLPYDLKRLVFSLGGEQKITTSDTEFRLTSDDLRSSIERTQGDRWLFKAEGRGVALATGEDRPMANLDAFIVNTRPTDLQADLIETSLTADAVTVDLGDRDIVLDRIEGFGTVSQAGLLHEPDAWRGARGTVDLVALSIKLGEAIVRFDGEVRLDNDNYPTGALNAEINDPVAFAVAVQEMGLLSEREGSALQGGLALAAMAQGGTVKGTLKMENGRATFLGLKVFDLPEVG
ncbi:MAG: DUF2125 domain-containing protein [Pseudomonadota bacterium]